MTRFKKGDRVRSDFLGDGTVASDTRFLTMVCVLWDTRPPVKYNMGANPSYEFPKNLTLTRTSRPHPA